MGCIPSKDTTALIPFERYRIPEKGRHPDHWFEIKLNNRRLFGNINLNGLPDMLPGRLFSTRMPRDLSENEKAKTDFERKMRKNKLDIVLILTEPEEYEKYAKTNLEAFYYGLGLRCLVFPIEDFSVPTDKEFAEMVKQATLNLADGKNILIHCAGGNGRTGMVLCGIIKTCGVRDPIEFARKTKSTYVETEEQAQMVNEFPIAVEVADALCAKHPVLAQIISLNKVIEEAKLKTLQEKRERARKMREESVKRFEENMAKLSQMRPVWPRRSFGYATDDSMTDNESVDSIVSRNSRLNRIRRKRNRVTNPHGKRRTNPRGITGTLVTPAMSV